MRSSLCTLTPNCQANRTQTCTLHTRTHARTQRVVVVVVVDTQGDTRARAQTRTRLEIFPYECLGYLLSKAELLNIHTLFGQFVVFDLALIAFKGTWQ